MAKTQQNTVNSEFSDEQLRPQTLSEYVGQTRLKANLKVFIGAAKKRGETLDHALFFGPPGLGKTTLAYVIANEMETKIRVVSGPSIEKPGDLASILALLEEGDVLFIDEIHRIPRIVEETLYTVMEDFSLNLVINQSDGTTRNINLDLPHFTLVGATTRSGNLSSPLRSRFGINEKIDFYHVDELQQIVIRTARILNMPIDDEAAHEIAKRSRGTPRIANRLLKRVRDFAEYENLTKINLASTLQAMENLLIDELGLDELDRQYLHVILDRFDGGPVGIEAVAASLGEEVSNLQDAAEPYLVQIGLINRSPKGRQITEKGRRHLRKAL